MRATQLRARLDPSELPSLLPAGDLGGCALACTSHQPRNLSLWFYSHAQRPFPVCSSRLNSCHASRKLHERSTNDTNLWMATIHSQFHRASSIHKVVCACWFLGYFGGFETPDNMGFSQTELNREPKMVPCLSASAFPSLKKAPNQPEGMNQSRAVSFVEGNPSHSSLARIRRRWATGARRCPALRQDEISADL